MPRVFVLQRQMRKNRDTGELEPRFTHEAAREFGELRYVLSPSIKPFNAEEALDELDAALAGFTAEDYLLLVGNPCLIGWATAVAAAKTGGPVRMLQWSRGRYIPVESNLGSWLHEGYAAGMSEVFG